jgi:hypothetical protein
MIHHQRFVIAKVTVGQAVHEPVTERIQQGAVPRRLRYAVERHPVVAQERSKGSHRDIRGSGERGVVRRYEIDMKLEQIEGIHPEAQQEIG